MIKIVKYSPELEQAFIRLNKEWISTYFHIEEHDEEVFADIKKNIIDTGGEIFFALSEGVPAGCCALIHRGKDNPLGEWELAKMAVSARYRGQGIGNRLMEALINEAVQHGISSIYLEGNTGLTASINMYRKFGFREIPLDKKNYERVDILMKWTNPNM